MTGKNVLEQLPKMAAAAAREFGDRVPSKTALSRYIVKKWPKMDGGIAIAIAASALILQAWSAYRVEQDIRKRQHGGNRCPKCDKPAIGETRTGKYKCVNRHYWQKP